MAVVDLGSDEEEGMIIKVKAATFIPAGTRCVTVALDGHWRPATPGAIEYAYARPNIDYPYPAVEDGDEFWVQIQDQVAIVHNVHRLRTDGKAMCGQERLIVGEVLTPRKEDVTCRACIDTCITTAMKHAFKDGKCLNCEQPWWEGPTPEPKLVEKPVHEEQRPPVMEVTDGWSNEEPAVPVRCVKCRPDDMGYCELCGKDMVGRPRIMEVTGGWSNEKPNANGDVLDDPKHEYSEECFCFSCKAFRQVGDEDFIEHLNAVTPLRGRIAMALWDFKKSRGHGMGEFGVLDENAWESLAMADAVLAVMDKPVPYKDPCPQATSPNSDQPAMPRCPEAAPDDKTGYGESPIAAHHKQAVKDRDTAMFALRDLVRAIDKKKKEECGCGSCRYGFEDFLDAGRELLTSLCPGCKGKYTENDKHTCVKEGD